MTEQFRILIANRGEIAKRIANVLLELNIIPIIPIVEKEYPQVYEKFPGCVLIKEQDNIFLNQEKLIEIAKENNCFAIHPGYGFLAENPDFAKLCLKNSLKFIGPSSNAIELMGDKETARNVAEKAGVPPVPGFSLNNLSFPQLKEKANAIGYPVLIKASKGGGGKGMRKIENESELEEGIRLAKSESLKYFSSDLVFIEKYIKNPRHIEIQIFSFDKDNTIYLGERECSIQRRHQKIIEETPSTFIGETLRKKMGECAVNLAKNVDYKGAGTVEFIVDKNKNFYFLEMNTRIQVEHPITEEIFSKDLVKWQIEQTLEIIEPIIQSEVKSNGYSIELRIYAEDPDNNFMPSPGKILLYKEPKAPGIRVESVVSDNYEIFPDFDPMIAKLIIKAENRKKGIEKAINALKNYVILGITTNRQYLINILKTKEFKNGETDTAFTEIHKEKLKNKEIQLENEIITAAVFGSKTNNNQKKYVENKGDYYPQITTRIP